MAQQSGQPVRGSTTLVLGSLALMFCIAGRAADYPTRPVRIIVGFGAGGPDTTARIDARAVPRRTPPL